MDIPALLLELYGRIPPLARRTVEALSPEQLTDSPGEGSNTIGWLIWHLTRVQDHHISELLPADQLWTTGEWAAGFGLGPDPDNTGYGHGASEVASVRPTGAAALIDYLDAVDERTRSFLGGLRDSDLDRVVDRRWDPPVTLAVRLISVADDCLQHVGQAAYVRGLLTR